LRRSQEEGRPKREILQNDGLSRGQSGFNQQKNSIAISKKCVDFGANRFRSRPPATQHRNRAVRKNEFEIKELTSERGCVREDTQLVTDLLHDGDQMQTDSQEIMQPCGSTAFGGRSAMCFNVFLILQNAAFQGDATTVSLPHFTSQKYCGKTYTLARAARRANKSLTIL
jgi:hypothetical protein